MASVIRRPNGLKSIQFVLHEKRQDLRIGKATMVQARKICVYIETILADRIANRLHDAETLNWINNLPRKLLLRAQSVGIVSGASRALVPLGVFLDECMVDIQKTHKPNTFVFYKNTIRNLISFFGAERRLSSITPDDATGFRGFLESRSKERGEGMISRATVNRRIGAARTFFTLARKRKIIVENPFRDVKGGEQVNRSRLRYIPDETVARVLAACPNAQWYVMICFARFGGVRCPSEIVRLRWQDIDWQNRKILIHSPKTEHIEGKGTRIIPLFPELEKALIKLVARLVVCDDQRDTYVITRYRDPRVNLGTQLKKIIKRAGVEPWPRLWQNLRASREMDLSRRFPLEVACDWIGNSPRIAMKHYMVTTENDFAAAVAYTSKI